MRIIFLIGVFLCLCGTNELKAQDSLTVATETVKVKKTRTKYVPEYDPLAPSKVAFYSAVLPGLGQAYNRSYWKIPLVYGGLAGGVYFYKQNNDQFHKYRNAYKRRLAGYNDDQFQGMLSDEGLIQAQKQFRKNKEISVFFTVVWYALNIVDANVEAHLKQFNVSENLSVQPNYQWDEISGNTQYGLSLNFKF